MSIHFITTKMQLELFISEDCLAKQIFSPNSFNENDRFISKKILKKKGIEIFHFEDLDRKIKRRNCYKCR
jgi:hypothetical protein